MNENGIVVEAELGQFHKNAMQTVVGRLVRVRGTPCADVRMFALNNEGQLVATRAGLCLSREKLPELRALVEALCAAAGGDKEAQG